VRWRIFWFYCLGAVVALIIMWLTELFGVLTTIIQFLTGVGGLLFDICFQKGVLDRTATPAATAMCCSHPVSYRSVLSVMKLVYGLCCRQLRLPSALASM
jgi:hypothetical protein